MEKGRALSPSLLSGSCHYGDRPQSQAKNGDE